jgi:hypothetical protein
MCVSGGLSNLDIIFRQLLIAFLLISPHTTPHTHYTQCPADPRIALDLRANMTECFIIFTDLHALISKLLESADG